MRVRTVEEAWKKANQIFPTDYMKDDKCSKNAGYPIFLSTAAGVNAWISDLNNRLEVNLPDGSTVNIWIDESLEEKLIADGFVKNCLGAWYKPKSIISTNN